MLLQFDKFLCFLTDTTAEGQSVYHNAILCSQEFLLTFCLRSPLKWQVDC